MECGSSPHPYWMLQAGAPAATRDGAFGKCYAVMAEGSPFLSLPSGSMVILSASVYPR